jgi:hypothetical protein
LDLWYGISLNRERDEICVPWNSNERETLRFPVMEVAFDRRTFIGCVLLHRLDEFGLFTLGIEGNGFIIPFLQRKKYVLRLLI